LQKRLIDVIIYMSLINYLDLTMSTASQINLINPHISQSVSENHSKHISNAVALAFPWVTGLLLMAFTPAEIVPTWFAWNLEMLFVTLSSIGLGIGFHRHYTHHAFKTSKAGKMVLGVMGTWTMQGSITSWVADHRRHHRFADQQFDPHSPWADDKGLISNRLAGWFHAHLGWKFTGAVSDEKRYVPDLLKDPVAVFLTRYYWPVAISGYLLPGALGWMYGGWQECATCLLWAGCFRAVVLQQFEGIANSLTHLFGSKVEGSQDESRNNMVITFVLLGEGLHSYHHQNATVAVNQPSKFDVFGHMIMFCERLGLVWDLRKGNPATIAPTARPHLGGLRGTATI
jgi:stearoyl-CoA desaturase (Delta-9 desaturase)